MYSARRELQGAADASALAGASGLLEGATTVKTRAIEYAGNIINSVTEGYRAIEYRNLGFTIGHIVPV